METQSQVKKEEAVSFWRGKKRAKVEVVEYSHIFSHLSLSLCLAHCFLFQKGCVCILILYGDMWYEREEKSVYIIAR